jgi:F0F1-type ATP synthase assembly protein I
MDFDIRTVKLGKDIACGMDKLKMPNQDPNDKPNHLQWASFGLEFGVVTAIFCYIGYQLDIAINSSPYFLLAGFFLSFTGMLYLIFKQLNNKREQ